MAYKILSDCNNCGACEPECPNTAISMGADVYVISAALCTECVAFHDTPQCAAVCPIDVCVTDPAVVETEEQLLKKVQKLHPEKAISGTFPSHFRK